MKYRTTELTERVAHLVDMADVERIDLMGPTVEFLVDPDEGEGEDAPCVMRGTIPPGGVVPLHSHADPETFLSVSGEVEGLMHSDEGFGWVRVRPGDVFHVPGGAKHAFRNEGRKPAISITITTPRIGRFFREIGTPIAAGARPPGPPSAETIRRFLEISERYGYWNASPEENAAIGIAMPPVA